MHLSETNEGENCKARYHLLISHTLQKAVVSTEAGDTAYLPSGVRHMRAIHRFKMPWD